MKYRNINTGEIFEDLDSAVDSLCLGHECTECILNDEELGQECEDVFLENLEELGFEVVEEGCISNLAKALGVEDKQEWHFTDTDDTVYRINYGARERKVGDKWEYCNNEKDLVFMISYPHLIRPVVEETKWTEREVEIAKGVKALLPSLSEFVVAYNKETPDNILVHTKESFLYIEHKGECPNFVSKEARIIKFCDILKDGE